VPGDGFAIYHPAAQEVDVVGSVKPRGGACGAAHGPRVRRLAYYDGQVPPQAPMCRQWEGAEE